MGNDMRADPKLALHVEDRPIENELHGRGRAQNRAHVSRRDDTAAEERALRVRSAREHRSAFEKARGARRIALHPAGERSGRDQAGPNRRRNLEGLEDLLRPILLFYVEEE